MKKLLALLLVLSMLFVFGCAKNEDKATSGENDVNTEAVENDASKDGEKAEAKKEEKKEPVKTDHIKEADDIETGDELTSLIEEINDEKTSPERKAELLELVGEFLSGAEGQTVSLPAEE